MSDKKPECYDGDSQEGIVASPDFASSSWSSLRFLPRVKRERYDHIDRQEDGSQRIARR